MLSLRGDNDGISPLVGNLYGGGFPRCCCVDKACLVSTVAVISEMVIITDNIGMDKEDVKLVVSTEPFAFSRLLSPFSRPPCF